MAEYYPLLAKAVASLPNSTPESRRLVYERARKALIGQLRTLHPPVAEQDIERESVALDRAIARLETELSAPAAGEKTAAMEAAPVAAGAAASRPASPRPAPPGPTNAAPRFPAGGALGPAGGRPTPPLRTKLPIAKPAERKIGPNGAPAQHPPAPEPVKDEIKTGAPKIVAPAEPRKPEPSKPEPSKPEPPQPEPPQPEPPQPEPPKVAPPLDPPKADAPAERKAAGPRSSPIAAEPAIPVAATASGALTNGLDGAPVADAPSVPPRDPRRDAVGAETLAKPRPEPHRPIAPQPPMARGPRRPLWIIPVGIGAVVLLVAVAAYKLRDRPETLAHVKPAEQTNDSSKIADRVGQPGAPAGKTTSPTPAPAPATTPAPTAAPSTEGQAAAPPNNPAAAVAGRAALLVEAPDEPNKVKTYLGTVVWRLDNVSDGQNQAVGLAVRADIDLPDDKLKASVVFQKNVDASLPASHTIKVRFMIEPGSATGGVKQINVPQMRQEDSATGDPLDGVTVPIVENSFLIGLSPGNSEAANLQLLNSREWIDIPMFLVNGRIAKLTFEKTDAGQRDLRDAIASWSKQ